MSVPPPMFSFTGGGLSAKIVLNLRLSCHFEIYLRFHSFSDTYIITSRKILPSYIAKVSVSALNFIDNFVNGIKSS